MHEEADAEVPQVGADPEAVVPLAVGQEADLAAVAAVQEDSVVETGVDAEEEGEVDLAEEDLVEADLVEAAAVDVAGDHIDHDDPFQNGNVPVLFLHSVILRIWRGCNILCFSGLYSEFLTQDPNGNGARRICY